MWWGFFFPFTGETIARTGERDHIERLYLAGQHLQPCSFSNDFKVAIPYLSMVSMELVTALPLVLSECFIFLKLFVFCACFSGQELSLKPDAHVNAGCSVCHLDVRNVFVELCEVTFFFKFPIPHICFTVFMCGNVE